MLLSQARYVYGETLTHVALHTLVRIVDLESVGVVLFSRGFLAMNPRFLKRPTRLFLA